MERVLNNDIYITQEEEKSDILDDTQEIREVHTHKLIYKLICT